MKPFIKIFVEMVEIKCDDVHSVWFFYSGMCMCQKRSYTLLYVQCTVGTTASSKMPTVFDREREKKVLRNFKTWCIKLERIHACRLMLALMHHKSNILNNRSYFEKEMRVLCTVFGVVTMASKTST